ncbi:MAG TPA: Uma2 family endonuclease [Paracoccaceae bacterium]|nr:Uma2 family endonuclease [Paracoccaceae bacterium]
MPNAALSDLHPLTREQYFALEERTQERHEMIEGVAYAMVGGTDSHSLVAMNLSALLHRAKSPPCQVFQQGVKLRIATDISETFFYPDVMLCCDPTGNNRRWRERPAFIAEVLSPATEQNDFGAKLLLYRSIPSLREYAVIGAAAAELTMYRRSAGWKPFAADLDAGIALETAPVRLDFAALYDGVTF